MDKCKSPGYPGLFVCDIESIAVYIVEDIYPLRMIFFSSFCVTLTIEIFGHGSKRRTSYRL